MTDVREALAILDAIADTIKEAGPEGASESHMYLAYMQAGGTYTGFMNILSILADAKKIRRSNHRSYWIGG